MRKTGKVVLTFLWLAGLLLPLGWLLRLMFGEPPAVPVSRETTFLTGRQLDDGSLDFSHALAKHCNAPIPDADNAAILLARMDLQTSLRSFRRAMHPALRGRSTGTDLSTSLPRIHATLSGPWRRDQFPVVAEMVVRETAAAQQWKAAIRPSSLVKPQGVQISHLREQILNGAELVIRRGNLAVTDGRMAQAIENWRSADKAAMLLVQLQCGWETESALRIRSTVGDALAATVLSTAQFDGQLADYIRERSRWDAQAAVCRAVDQAVRIQFQIAVRNFRNDEARLLALTYGGLIGPDQRTRDLQFATIRNGISWSQVSRIQNEDVDSVVAALQAGTGRGDNSCRSVIEELENRNNGDLIASVTHLRLGELTQQIGILLSRISQHDVLMPLIVSSEQLEDSTRCSLIALELAAYREAHGEFPNSLSDLANDHRNSVFRDPQTGDALNYSREGTGFHIWAANGRYRLNFHPENAGPPRS